VAKAFGIRKENLLCRRRNATDRAVAAWSLVRFAGLSQREVAQVLHMGSGSAVSQQITRLKNPPTSLKEKLARVEQQLLSSI